MTLPIPIAADLAADADVREEFRRRTGGPLPRAMRGECADLIFGAPEGAHLPTGAAGAALPHHPSLRTARRPGAGRLFRSARRLCVVALLAGAALALVAIAACFDGN